jgi:2'-5' RNA ligase
LATEYQWQGLTEALQEFAHGHQPFEVRTVGLISFSGENKSVAVAPYKDARLAEYHSELWDVISKFALERIDPFYHPDTWVPHVTIKRCGRNTDDFARAMGLLADQGFAWSFTVDNVSVQYDPGRNSLTHYQRVYFPLGGRSTATTPELPETNGTIVAVTRRDQIPTVHHVRVQLDDGDTQELDLDAPEVLRLMAAAKSSTVHFPGGRCRLEDGRIVHVEPNTPFPIA